MPTISRSGAASPGPTEPRRPGAAANRPGTGDATLRELPQANVPDRTFQKVEVALDRDPMTPWRKPRPTCRIAAHHIPAKDITPKGPCRFIPRSIPNPPISRATPKSCAASSPSSAKSSTRSRAAAARCRASGIPRAARCWRATASISWSIPAPHSSNCRRWRPMASMAATCIRRASSPASGGSRGANASSSPTMPPSRAAPIIR